MLYFFSFIFIKFALSVKYNSNMYSTDLRRNCEKAIWKRKKCAFFLQKQKKTESIHSILIKQLNGT